MDQNTESPKDGSEQIFPRVGSNNPSQHLSLCSYKQYLCLKKPKNHRDPVLGLVGLPAAELLSVLKNVAGGCHWDGGALCKTHGPGQFQNLSQVGVSAGRLGLVEAATGRTAKTCTCCPRKVVVVIAKSTGFKILLWVTHCAVVKRTHFCVQCSPRAREGLGSVLVLEKRVRETLPSHSPRTFLQVHVCGEVVWEL